MKELLSYAPWLVCGSLAMIAAQSVVVSNSRWRGLLPRRWRRAESEGAEQLADVLYLMQEQAVQFCEAAKQHGKRIEDINAQLLSTMSNQDEQCGVAISEAAAAIIHAGRQMQDRCTPLIESLQQHRKQLGCRRNVAAITEGLGLRTSYRRATALSGTGPADTDRHRASLFIEPTEESLPVARINARLSDVQDGEPDHSAETQNAAPAPGVERRGSPRRPFPYVQHVAAYQNDGAPQADAFAEVECHDLSATGFSFWAQEPPEQRYLVIRFGASNDLIYLAAEVIHATPRDRDGQAIFIVGCRFLQRLEV